MIQPRRHPYQGDDNSLGLTEVGSGATGSSILVLSDGFRDGMIDGLEEFLCR